MGADYLISSLPDIPPDGPAPLTKDDFCMRVREQLSAKDADGVTALLNGTPSAHPLAVCWRDLETQIRNTIAAERARLLNVDALKWRRPAAGCSLYWTGRTAAAFQEKDPARRDRLLDCVFFDAAGELTPPESPLSTAAVFTYAIRLAIALRRAAISTSAGNEVFNRLTAASAPESVLKGQN